MCRTPVYALIRLLLATVPLLIGTFWATVMLPSVLWSILKSPHTAFTPWCCARHRLHRKRRRQQQQQHSGWKGGSNGVIRGSTTQGGEDEDDILDRWDRDQPPRVWVEWRGHRWGHRYLLANGMRLHYVVTGADETTVERKATTNAAAAAAATTPRKPLMLFLHGFPESWYSWRHQLLHFADKYVCVAIDMRGYGWSEKPAQRQAYAMPLLIEDVHRTIKALGYDRADALVAHDWGAFVAWSFALKLPDMVAKLVICNVPHPRAFTANLSLRQLLKSWYVFLFQLPFVAEFVFMLHGYRQVEQVFWDSMVHPERITRQDMALYKWAAARPGALTATINYYRNLFNPDQMKGVPSVRLKMPILVLWGERDAFLDTSLTCGYERWCDKAQVQLLEDASHWVQQDQPDKVNAFITQFLSEE